jgi:hypothetical protein
VRVDVTNLPTLDLTDIENDTSEMLHARGAAYAREHARIDGAQTVLLKNIATVIVEIRRRHNDWLGRTYEYRQEVADMYRQANIPPDSLSSLQTAVRWHVSTQLRNVLPSDELKRLELSPASGADKQRDRRAVDSALLQATKLSASAATPVPTAVTKAKKGKKAEASAPVEERVPAQGATLKATADHLRLAAGARRLVEQLDMGVIDEHMTPGQRARLDEELAAMQAAIAKLRRRTRTRSSDA